MLTSQVAVRENAKKLKNCAADYIPSIVAQRSALVGLFDTRDGKNKILAMGELKSTLAKKIDVVVTKFGQRVRACNQTLTKRQEKLFRQAEPQLSAIWTEAIKSELQGVLPPSNMNRTSLDELSDLAKLLAVRMLIRTTTAEGWDGVLKCWGESFFLLVDEITPQLPSAVQWEDQVRLTRIVTRLMKADVKAPEASSICQAVSPLDTKSKVSILVSDLPFAKSELADALTPPLLSAAQSGDQNLLTRIVTRLRKANVNAPEAKSIYQAASQLDTKSKLSILLSDLPFAKSELADALTPLLLSAVQLDDEKLVGRILTRLREANVSASEIRTRSAAFMVSQFADEMLSGLVPHLLSAVQWEDQARLTRIVTGLMKADVKAPEANSICQAASPLDTKSKVSILVSDLPFSKSELADALTPPLLSAAQLDDEKLVGRILTRLSEANVSASEISTRLAAFMVSQMVDEMLSELVP